MTRSGSWPDLPARGGRQPCGGSLRCESTGGGSTRDASPDGSLTGGPNRRTSITQPADPIAMSGEILTAAVTPARSIVPATSPPRLAPPTSPTRMNAPIIAEVTAATGEPIPIASPALTITHSYGPVPDS